jgi:general stress protein 26
MSKSPQQEFDDLIDTFETAMLVTTSLSGQPRARPMAIAEHRPGGALYFATRAEDEKVDEILREPEVAITMQDEKRYLSITGRARLETDRQHADELWSPAMRLWFPEGPSDPHLALIRTEPDFAEFWNRGGLRGLEFLWVAGEALLRGRKVPDKEFGGHAKVRLHG